MFEIGHGFEVSRPGEASSIGMGRDEKEAMSSDIVEAGGPSRE